MIGYVTCNNYMTIHVHLIVCILIHWPAIHETTRVGLVHAG